MAMEGSRDGPAAGAAGVGAVESVVCVASLRWSLVDFAAARAWYLGVEAGARAQGGFSWGALWLPPGLVSPPREWAGEGGGGLPASAGEGAASSGCVWPTRQPLPGAVSALPPPTRAPTSYVMAPPETDHLAMLARLVGGSYHVHPKPKMQGAVCAPDPLWATPVGTYLAKALERPRRAQRCYLRRLRLPASSQRARCGLVLGRRFWLGRRRAPKLPRC